MTFAGRDSSLLLIRRLTADHFQIHSTMLLQDNQPVSVAKTSLRAMVFGFCMIGIVWVAIEANAFSHFRRAYYYGDAEQTVESLRTIYFPDFTLTANEVESRLRTDPAAMDVTRVPESKLQKGDLILFQVNTMFTVGLKKDGATIWIVDGVRSPGQGQR